MCLGLGQLIHPWIGYGWMDGWMDVGDTLCLGLGQLIHAWIDHGWMNVWMDG